MNKLLEAPVLCSRIPTPPWGDPATRVQVMYDRFVETGVMKVYAKR